MKSIEGLDGYIVQAEDASQTDFSSVEPDVILDYVYGDITARCLSTIATKKPVQFVQIGTLSGAMETALPAAALRGKNITMRGSGPGAWSPQEVMGQMPKMLPAMAEWPLDAVTEVRLKDIESVWEDKSIKGRIVVVP